MTEKDRKLEPPLHLDMPFEEALERFAHTRPEEVEPPKGKRPKIEKTAKQLASHTAQTNKEEEKRHSRTQRKSNE